MSTKPGSMPVSALRIPLNVQSINKPDVYKRQCLHRRITCLHALIHHLGCRCQHAGTKYIRRFVNRASHINRHHRSQDKSEKMCIRDRTSVSSWNPCRTESKCTTIRLVCLRIIRRLNSSVDVYKRQHILCNGVLIFLNQPRLILTFPVSWNGNIHITITGMHGLF